MLQMRSGFSLIEVLVSLFVVSLTALNLTALQQRISAQQRDNLAHSAAISLATEKMEGVLSLTHIDDLTALNDSSETEIQIGNTEFTVQWNVGEVDSELNAGENFREVEMDISWLNAKGDTLSFTHSQQVNLALLLSGASNTGITEQLAGVIVSSLEINDDIYFDPKMGYKKGAFVIHDSYLYQATSVHSLGNGHPRTVTDPATGIESGSDGWQSYGRIDNPELASNVDLATFFYEF
ncbi:prepilin-type N-terminal cleavage/methylation domain-containing protein [Psychromonas sp.]|nr:prepilin-type N-terminal cleavage/methylation domain-containing protein [Psychromonas sp.]